MTDQTAPWTIHVYGFLAHPEQERIWALPEQTGLREEQAGCRLPALQFVQEKRWLRAPEIITGLEDLLGVLLHLLWYHSHEDEAQHTVVLTAVLEARDGQPQQPGRWITPDEGECLALPAERSLLEQFFMDARPENIPAERALWARPGWRAGAEAWISASLQNAGKGSVKKFTLLRTWGISCLLTSETERGELYYFKAVIDEPLFVNEGPLTLALAGHFPEIIQPPVAVQAKERWMLSPAFSGVIQWDRPLSEMVQLVTTWAQYQQRSIPLVETLLAAGCIDRRLDWLAGQVHDLFHDEEATTALTSAEKARLQAAVPEMAARCQALAACEIPPALVHGDLHGGNIAVRLDGQTIFDWTDVCITHPFLDMLLIYNADDPGEVEPLQQAYLSEWEAFASPGRLLEIWELARPVFNLHHALSYHTIVKHLEPAAKGDLDWGAPHFLRKILESVS